MSAEPRLHFREEVRADDLERVREIVTSTGFFYAHEVAVAVELVQERLNKGLASGYHFLFAERDSQTVGYCCYGPIACTEGSFDVFWIAVHNQCRSQGVGKILLRETERLIAGLGGRCIWVETSGQEKYQPTRDFYVRARYQLEAVLKDFYGPGDDKLIFVKRLG